MHNACTLVKFLKTQENLPAITADPIKDALFDVETIEDTNTGKVSHVKLIHFEELFSEFPCQSRFHGSPQIYAIMRDYCQDVTLAMDDIWSFAHDGVLNVAKNFMTRRY